MAAARALFQAELRVGGIVVPAHGVGPQRFRQLLAVVRQAVDHLHGRRQAARAAVRLQERGHIGRIAVPEPPLKALFAAVNEQALLISAGCLKQRARRLRHKAVRKHKVRRFDGIGVAVACAQLLAHRAGAEAGYARDRCAGQCGQRRHGVRAIPERGQALPIGRPVLHVLIMRAAQELDTAHLPAAQHLLHIAELIRVERRLHHHEMLAGFALRVQNGLHILQAGGHGHRAGAVLPGAQHAHRLGRVIRDRRHEVDGVHLRIGQHVLKGIVHALNPVKLRHFFRKAAIQIADAERRDRRVILPDGRERTAEPEADEHHLASSVFHRILLPAKRSLTPV